MKSFVNNINVLHNIDKMPNHDRARFLVVNDKKNIPYIRFVYTRGFKIVNHNRNTSPIFVNNNNNNWHRKVTSEIIHYHKEKNLPNIEVIKGIA